MKRRIHTKSREKIPWTGKFHNLTNEKKYMAQAIENCIRLFYNKLLAAVSRIKVVEYY